MSRASLYSMLAVLLVAVHSIVAFSSNIHEKMTKAERLMVFGSENSVPEYQVFSMSLPEDRHKRETDKTLKLHIQLGNQKVNLTLKPTAGYLATKYTPVWLAKSDEHAYQKIRYDPYPTAMSDIGEFKMYHDVENEAAVTTYTDPTEGIIIEGIVTPYYVIRSLPKRLMGELLKPGRHIISKDFVKKRSVTSDAEEDTGHIVVFKVQAAPNRVKPQILIHPNNLQREKRARDGGEKRKLPKTVYPEILVVLDHNAIRDRTTTRALRFMLAFWNGADLMYSALDKPKVRLNIAGIIIAADNWVTPYIASNVSTENADDGRFDPSEMGKYFYEERVRFPLNWYDVIIAMTTIGMCGTITVGRCYQGLQKFEDSTACLSTHEVSRMKTIKNNAIVGYNWEFAGLIITVETLAIIFGAEELYAISNAECSMNNGYILSAWGDNDKIRNFKWSKCSRRYLTEYFSSTKFKCFDNKPRWRKTLGKVLPGRWMSTDGQCRNEGYAKACKLKKKSMCVAKGCLAKGSVKCIRTRKAALPGSTCASNKHCSTKKKCVPN